MSEKIIPGDAQYASRVRWIVMAFLVGVGLCWLWIKARLDQLVASVDSDPMLAAAQLHDFVQIVTLGMWLVGILIGLWLFRIALRIFRDGQYPSPGAKVMRPTTVVFGRPAYIRAVAALIAGTLLAGGAIIAGLMVLAEVSRIAPPPGL